MNEAIANAATVGAQIDAVETELQAAGLFFGHGTDNPRDEAAALVYFVCDLEHDGDASAYQRAVSDAERAEIRQLTDTRIKTRTPLAYLTGEAWFAGLRFRVDQRVLVPRSPLAELIVPQFSPWVEPGNVRRILEIGTGSGCIAIACAHAFPDAEVVATDISADALAVAAANAADHGVTGRLRLVETDHTDGVDGSFDLIVSNPPYVPVAEEAAIPAEYRHEPALGLYSGADGLDSARRILQDAPLLLSDQGVLALEVGAQWQQLEQAFPHLPFTWVEFGSGGEGVALIFRADL
ncbi:MAG: 50S ribosomal protein L3 N(5)-glutamine methyltransferase [Gammaproteobacteria bacterium]|nr:50S ribosomal protein L3 N(5)-glutamine methyltransferase [Gammaproteobacteria bacterium]NND53635.1 50S ribosomal protein L3 N(5)-glutamine methyltransferase [Gammaproteobacteria bacterium]